ncbi:hypothetical protein IQ22_01554 [Pseudomonas duriflava]|uniref:Uncharacterized protein n=1 Tax=Pseudomonas duriflava TaxID=459528 RepID=A0A562QFV3_9PSED|nr:hypothetical protein IQ22_01554 [Pseudomonas duriflava]
MNFSTKDVLALPRLELLWLEVGEAGATSPVRWPSAYRSAKYPVIG